MKIIGKLKKQVDAANNKEEAKRLIERAGFVLSDAELDMVTGGTDISSISPNGDYSDFGKTPFNDSNSISPYNGGNNSSPYNGGNNSFPFNNDNTSTVNSGTGFDIIKNLKI